MKEFYLIKFRNGIPFIIGQYDTEEEAVEGSIVKAWILN